MGVGVAQGVGAAIGMAGAVALPVVLGRGVPHPMPLGDAPHEDVSDGVGMGDP